jgi:hypothetical protein
VDILATIAVFIFFIVLRNFAKPRMLMERMKNPPPYPAAAKPQEVKSSQSTLPVRVYEPAKRNVPASAYKPISSRSEDSSEHDRWEPMTARISHLDQIGSTVTEDSREADRIYSSEAGVDMVLPEPLPDLLPDLTGQGIVRAVIMQEILGNPRSKQKDRHSEYCYKSHGL